MFKKMPDAGMNVGQIGLIDFHLSHVVAVPGGYIGSDGFLDICLGC